MQRACDSCQQPYEAKTKRSKYCERLDCKRQRERDRKRDTRSGEVVPLKAVNEQSDDLSAVTVTRQALEQAERLHTPAGVNALLLAAKLDAGGDTGSAMAALSKQHLAALAEATKGVKVVADPIDELRRRRDAKRAHGA